MYSIINVKSDFNQKTTNIASNSQRPTFIVTGTINIEIESYNKFKVFSYTYC